MNKLLISNTKIFQKNCYLRILHTVSFTFLFKKKKRYVYRWLHFFTVFIGCQFVCYLANTLLLEAKLLYQHSHRWKTSSVTAICLNIKKLCFLTILKYFLKINQDNRFLWWKRNTLGNSPLLISVSFVGLFVMRALNTQIRKPVNVDRPRRENLCSFNKPKGSTLPTFPPSDNI